MEREGVILERKKVYLRRGDKKKKYVYVRTHFSEKLVHILLSISIKGPLYLWKEFEGPKTIDDSFDSTIFHAIICGTIITRLIFKHNICS